MLYYQYREASLKHLNASKASLKGIKVLEKEGGLTNQEKNALLINIFYLSGYTLECIINYAIYKRIGWTKKPVKDMYDLSMKIAFYKEPRGISDPSTGNQFRPQYFIAQHKFNENIRMLADIFRISHPGQSITLINDISKISINVQKMILKRVGSIHNNAYWRPELRYETTIPFTHLEIEEFVQLTENIYIELLKIS